MVNEESSNQSASEEGPSKSYNKTTVGKDPELKSGGSDCTSLWGNAETVT